MAEGRDNYGRFTKGNSGRPPGTHRPKGAVSRWTADVKDGVIHGAASHGEDGHGRGGFRGYMRFLAAKHPRVYAGLIARLLPLQVNSPPGQQISQVTIMAVPSGQYLTKAEIEELSPGLDKVIDIERYEPSESV